MKKLKMNKAVLACLLAALAGLATSHAQELFDGKTVGYQYLFPNIGDVYTGNSTSFVVGGGVELAGLYGSNTHATVDVSDTNILIGYYGSANWSNDATFNGFRIYDINGTLPDFTSVTINPATTMPGLDAGRISFDANNIWVNWQGLSADPSTVVSLDVNTVPEPGSAALIALGLGSLLLRRRRPPAAV